MLFMNIFTVELGKEMEVIRRRAEKGPITGGKIIGEWATIEGRQVFQLSQKCTNTSYCQGRPHPSFLFWFLPDQEACLPSQYFVVN